MVNSKFDYRLAVRTINHPHARNPIITKESGTVRRRGRHPNGFALAICSQSNTLTPQSEIGRAHV